MQLIARPFGPAARGARPPAAARPAGRAQCVRVRASAEYDALKGLRVLKASTGEPVELLDLWTVRWLPGPRRASPGQVVPHRALLTPGAASPAAARAWQARRRALPDPFR
jgi:hypothetical protein